MEKMEVDETPDKSLRALHPNSTKKEVFEKVCEYEGDQSKLITKSKHLNELLHICDEFSEIVQISMHLKESDNATKKEDIDLMKEAGFVLLTRLRRMNRLQKIKLKQVKDKCLNIRQTVDADHLFLQNLLYEATHLKKMVTANKLLRGKDEQIDLIPIERFYAEAPESVSKPEITKHDDHLLKIARLEHEYFLRQNLAEKCVLMENKKEEIAKESEKIQTKLDSIHPLLTSILEACKPLESFFGISDTQRRSLNKKAMYLPPPLYVLFVNSVCYMDLSGRSKGFSVNIGGSHEDSLKLLLSRKLKIMEDDDSDSDVEQEKYDNGSPKHKKMRRHSSRSSVTETPEDPKKKFLEQHPMFIEWEVKKKNETIRIQFFYMNYLDIICVKSKFGESVEPKKAIESIKKSDNILINLSEGDSGLESPNPANSYVVELLEISSFSQLVDEIGRPFLWAHKLGKLEYSSSYPSLFDASGKELAKKTNLLEEKDERLMDNVHSILKLIRRRLSKQETLGRQLLSLDVNSIAIPPEAKALFPSKNNTMLVKWEGIEWNEYQNSPLTKQFTSSENPIATPTDYYFKATIERGRGTKVFALVFISIDFPSKPPVFTIQIEEDGERDALNDSAIRDIEKEVNVYAIDDFADWPDFILSLQIQRVLYCIDILAETDLILGESSGPAEFAKEKLFYQTSKGANQRRPFVYFVQGGGFYKQRF